MKKIKIFILIILSFGLFGCTGKQDINQLVLVSAIGFDKTENGMKLVAQIVNRNILVPNPPQISPVYIVTAEGETVYECLNNLNNLLPNRMYMINLQLVLFSEEVAKDGIRDYLHYFVNYSEAQHEYNVLLTKDISAEEFLSQISVFSMFPTRTLISKLKTAVDETGFAKMTFVENVVNSLRGEYGVLVISSVNASGDLKKGGSVDQSKETNVASNITITDMAVLKKGVFQGWLNKEESIAHNLINNNVKNTVMVVDGTKNNKISSYIRHTESKIKVKIENGKPKATIEIKLGALVEEDTSLFVELDKEYERHVKNKIEEKLTKEITELIKRSKNEFGFDLLEIYEKFIKHEQKWWEENKANYDEIFKTMDIEVKVNVTIERLDI